MISRYFTQQLHLAPPDHEDRSWAYFRSWRRKIGAVTLAMGCLVVLGWVKGGEICDVLNVPLGDSNAITLMLGNGSIVCRAGWCEENPWEEFAWYEVEVAWLPHLDSSGLPSSEYLFENPLPTGEGDVVHWSLIGRGFGLGNSASMDPYHRRCCYVIIPYWSIVIPLTLLSAYLLLSKPRKSHGKRNHFRQIVHSRKSLVRNSSPGTI